MMYDSPNRWQVAARRMPAMLRGLVCLVACVVLAGSAAGTLYAQEAEQPAAEEAPADQGDGHNDGHNGGAHGATHDGLHRRVYDPATLRDDLAIWTFVVFMVVLAVLWKFAWGPIVEGLERREQRIADNIAAAERQNKQAADLLKAYELKLQNAANEVREILEEARRDAQHTQEEILAKARAEAEAERQRALRDIEIAKEQALKQIGEEGANLAVDLAGRIIRAQLTPQDHARLIQEAMGEFVNRTPCAN